MESGGLGVMSEGEEEASSTALRILVNKANVDKWP